MNIVTAADLKTTISLPVPKQRITNGKTGR